MLSNKSKTFISAAPLGLWAYFREIFKYRHLLVVFAGQEIRGMYAQTYLGVSWAVIRPLFTLAIFTFIFKFLLHVHTQAPYYLFAFTGLIAWNFFSQIATSGSIAIIQKQGLIHKMYFPKLILPLSKVLIASLELGASLVMLFLLFAVEQFKVTANILTLPLFIFLNISCAFAIAIWMNALNIRFRDLNQIIPAIIGMAIWVTPVFYPTTIIPPQYSFFLYANPMAGIIKGYRFALLAESFPEWQYWISIFATFVIMFTGIWYLSRVEDSIVDFS